MTTHDTNAEYSSALKRCRDVFAAKLEDYGASWRIMRPEAITDQLFIKAKRIRTLQTTGVSKVDEGIVPEFIGIVNYGIVGVIQLRLWVCRQQGHKQRASPRALRQHSRRGPQPHDS